MDTITLAGIRAYGYIGLLPEEQTLGQWFEVTLTLALDLTTAGTSDRLEDTFDYRQAITAVQTRIQTERYHLIETLATAIAHDALSWPSIQQVQVQVTKPAAPIPNFDGTITISLTRP